MNLGTNEPNIVKRGNNRILVELPGLDDPARIKNLLGKTANLSFQFVSQKKKKLLEQKKLNTTVTIAKMKLSVRE